MSALDNRTAALLGDLRTVRPESHNPVFVAALIRRTVAHIEAMGEAIGHLESSEVVLVARVQDLERKPRK